MHTVRLLLVDDSPAVLRQVQQLVPSPFEIVCTLGDGAGLVGAIDTYWPDIIVLDITLPGVNGLVLATQLRSAGCAANVVFLTVHSDADYLRAALTTGPRATS